MLKINAIMSMFLKTRGLISDGFVSLKVKMI